MEDFMTDGQFTALLAVIGGAGTVIAAALRFAVNRIVKALDRNSDTNTDVVKSMAVLVTKIDNIDRFVDEHTGRVHRVDDSITPVENPKKRRHTSPVGTPITGPYSFTRPSSKKDDDQ